MSDWSDLYAARSYVSAKFTTTSGSYAKALLDTLDFDTGGIVDTTNTKLVAPATGVYVIAAHTYWTNLKADGATACLAAGRRWIEVRKNGTAIHNISQAHSLNASSNPQAFGQDFIKHYKLVAADYLELYVFQDSGDTVQVHGSVTSDAGLATSLSISFVCQA